MADELSQSEIDALLSQGLPDNNDAGGAAKDAARSNQGSDRRLHP